jgi:Protein of unknown function (DUF2909)
MKYLLVGLAFVGIITALVSAGVFMLRGGSGKARAGNMARALAVRVGLSITLFLCILIAWHFGWIHPTGIPVSN